MYVREMAVAGQFYPLEATQLEAVINACLDATQQQQLSGQLSVCPKVLVVPHAGLRFSGSTAARAYAQLKPFADHIKRVVMIGPSHHVSFKGIAFEPAHSVETPFGEIPVNKEGLDFLTEKGLVVASEQAHAREHCLEVQWPFLQRVLNDFAVTPLVVGDAPKHEVAEVLAALWGGNETLILISTDLSHYHPANICEGIDSATCALVTSANSHIVGEQACGFKALNGLLYLAKSYGLPVKQIAYSHSGQTGGPTDRVVGYGAFKIDQPKGFSLSRAQHLSDADKRLLLELSRKAIGASFTESSLTLDADELPAHLMQRGACFVSLHKQGVLRGCIGSLEAHQALALDVLENSVKAAFKDPRFPPVEENELGQLEIEISVLTPPRKRIFENEEELINGLEVGRDGLIIQSGRHRATFLPLVWRSLNEPWRFVEQLKLKAGLPAQGWPEDIQIWTYEAICFGE